MATPFTIADHSIDVIGSFFFAATIFWGVHYLWENHLSAHARIILGFMIVVSALHIFQVLYQVATDGFSIFRVWDFINYITAILFLMLTHRIAKKETTL